MCEVVAGQITCVVLDDRHPARGSRSWDLRHRGTQREVGVGLSNEFDSRRRPGLSVDNAGGEQEWSGRKFQVINFVMFVLARLLTMDFLW